MASTTTTGVDKVIIPQGWSFACWRTPGAASVKVVASSEHRTVGGCDWDEVLNMPGYLSVPFDVQEDASVWIPASRHYSFSTDELSAGRLLVDHSGLATSVANDDILCDAYLAQVSALIGQIGHNHLSKIILSRSVAVPFNADNAMAAFIRLCNAYPDAYVFWFYTRTSGMWMGATPELLLAVSGGKLATVALAGTRSSRLFECDQPWENKEIEEQALVSRFIDDVLFRHQAIDINIKGPFTVKAGGVQHIKTEFVFQHRVPDHGIGLLLGELHPTPAVCGLPKQAAMDVIRAVERYHRFYYGGFQGETGADSMAFYVTIRCMQLIEQSALLYVGGGITADSDPLAEWHETELKAQTLLAVIKNM